MARKILIEVEVEGKDAAQVLRTVKDEVARLGASAEQASKEVANKERSLKRLMDRLEPGRVALERYQRQQELLNYGLRTGSIDAHRHADAMKELERRYMLGTAGTKDFGNAIQNLWSYIGGAAVLYTLARGLSDVVAEAAKAEQSIARIEAVLTATNSAANLTSAGITGYADAMQRLTGVAGDVIQDAEAILLTFRNVREDAFYRTMTAALDLSAVMGTDLQGSIVMLGKALEDPITGLTSLTRVGVSFSESEKEIIKDLVRHNELAEAQARILATVEAQVGGVATAMGSTFQGTLNKVSEAFGDLQESMGGSVTGSESTKAALEGLAITIGALATGLRALSDAYTVSSGMALLFKHVEEAMPLLGPFAQAINALVLTWVDMGQRQREANEAGAEYLRQHPEFKAALNDKLRSITNISVQTLPAYTSATQRATEAVDMAALADKVMADEVKRLTDEYKAADKALKGSLNTWLDVTAAEEAQLDAVGGLTPEYRALTDQILVTAGAILNSAKPSHEALAKAIEAVQLVAGDITRMVLWETTMERIAQSVAGDLGNIDLVASGLKLNLDDLFGFPPPPPDMAAWQSFWNGILAPTLGRSFSDTVLDVLGGADFSDAFDNIWEGLWNAAAGVMDRVFTEVLRGGDFMKALQDVGLVGASGKVNWGGVGLMAGGLLWGAGAQRGNPLMGGLGGAMAGAGLWSTLGGTLGGSGAAGPWGLVAAAIIGGILGYVSSNSGGRKDFLYKIAGGVPTVAVEDMDYIRREDAARQFGAAYRGYNRGFRDVLFTMGQTSFPDMSRFEWSTSGSSQDPGGVLTAIMKGQLPRAMLSYYREALTQGMTGLGVTAGRAGQEYDILARSDFTTAFAAFQQWVTALKALTDVRADLGRDLASLREEVRRGIRQVWSNQVDDTLAEIARLSQGLSQLTTEEQVARAGQIAGLAQQQYQASLQYLSQLASIRTGIAESVSGTLLGWQEQRAREKGPAAQQRFYIDQLTALKGRLAGATSAEDVQKIMGQITGYAQSLWSVSAESRQLFPAGDLRYGRTAIEQWMREQQVVADQLVAGWEAEAQARNEELRTATDAILQAMTTELETRQAGIDLGKTEAQVREDLVDLIGDELEVRRELIAAVAENVAVARSLAEAQARLGGQVRVVIDMPAGATGLVTQGAPDLVTLIQRGALPAVGVG